MAMSKIIIDSIKYQLPKFYLILFASLIIAHIDYSTLLKKSWSTKVLQFITTDSQIKTWILLFDLIESLFLSKFL